MFYMRSSMYSAAWSAFYSDRVRQLRQLCTPLLDLAPRIYYVCMALDTAWFAHSTATAQDLVRMRWSPPWTRLIACTGLPPVPSGPKGMASSRNEGNARSATPLHPEMAVCTVA